MSDVYTLDLLFYILYIRTIYYYMYTTLHILPIYVYRIIIYNTYGTILSILLYFYKFNCSKKKCLSKCCTMFLWTEYFIPNYMDMMYPMRRDIYSITRNLVLKRNFCWFRRLVFDVIFKYVKVIYMYILYV